MPNKLSFEFTPDFNSMNRIIFWNSMGFLFFNFLIPYVTAQQMDANGVQLGLMYSLLTIGGIISTPIVGFLTDRSSKKRLVFIGSIGRGTSYLLIYISILINSLFFFGFAMFFLGFTVGIFWPPFNTLVAEKSNKQNRSRAFGKSQSMMGWGNLTGSLICFPIFILVEKFLPGNIILQYSPLILFAITNFLAGYTFNKNVDENTTYDVYLKGLELENSFTIDPIIIQENKEGQILDNDKLSSNFQINSKMLIMGSAIMVIGIFFANINESIAGPFLQSYLSINIVSDPLIIIIVFAPSGIISMILAPYVGKLVDRSNLPIGFAISSLLGAVVTFFIIRTDSALIFSILLIFDNAFASAAGLILTNVMSRITKHHRGKVFGLQNWIGRIGGIIGPTIGGIAWDQWGMTWPFIISIFVELALIPLFIYAIKYMEPNLEEQIDTKIITEV